MSSQPNGHFIAGRAPAFPRPYAPIKSWPPAVYITSPLLRHFLEAPVKPRTMVVMVQKEVAETIVAEEGHRSLLSIAVQFYGRPEIVADVPAAAFFPAPEVDSAVVKIDVYDRPPVDIDNVNGFFKLVKAGFSAARKQVANALTNRRGCPRRKAWRCCAGGHRPKRRAETFSLDDRAACGSL
jgi:16S rRNA (adenine1518-N6/adenine1519-N6)-dimethyltransferase